ncbi:hypothetical protein [Streptomyces sp. NK15101]|uniref:hypothetical protein n=1 Tax=Streptomyces sp. NK15101 TaxID=2873261 RepID=UPI001CECAF89|nr:hypothetical protein [Streptomyces sp. NK15101]
MIAVIAIVAGGLIAAGIFYDIARLITPDESRRPPLARLAGRRAALAAAERRLIALRLRDRIDAAAYERRMTAIAHGHRLPEASAQAGAGGRHG